MRLRQKKYPGPPGIWAGRGEFPCGGAALPGLRWDRRGLLRPRRGVHAQRLCEAPGGCPDPGGNGPSRLRPHAGLPSWHLPPGPACLPRRSGTLLCPATRKGCGTKCHWSYPDRLRVRRAGILAHLVAQRPRGAEYARV